MIWSISYHINVIEFGLWSCGLCQRTLKSWHILRNFRKICGFLAGHSDALDRRSIYDEVAEMFLFCSDTILEQESHLSFSVLNY